MLPAKRNQKPPAKSAFTRALERFRQQRAPKDIGPELEKLAGSTFEQPAPLEEFHLRIRCAVTGGYARMNFRRAPSGRYTAQGPAMKIDSGAGGSGQAHTAAVSLSQVDELPAAPCPWCRALHMYSRVYCQKCRELVCTGRSYVDAQGEFIFVCREGCGSRGPVQKKLSSYEVRRMENLPGPAAPALEAPRRQAALPAVKNLLLSGRKP